MQVVTFLIISLVSTIVSSTKCKNPELKCIELCCEKTQYFHSLSQHCEDSPNKSKASWLALLQDNKTMEVVEYGECDKSVVRQTHIPSCYAPDYNETSKKFYFKELTYVTCNRITQPLALPLEIGALICILSLPICFPIMLVYTCRNTAKENFTFKLVSWYLVSMAAYFGALLIGWVHMGISKKLEDDVAKKYAYTIQFFLYTSYVWQNIIGFQVWSGLKGDNIQTNSNKATRRCVYYCLIVWSLSALIFSLYFIASSTQWEFNVQHIMVAVPCFNLLTYFLLSLNICITRCRVINLAHETHFKRNLTILILRLALVMGIPRMIIAALGLFINVNRILFTIFIVLEPYVVFTVLVWKPKRCFRCNFGCGCCRKSDPPSNAAEMVCVDSNRD